MLRSLRRDWDYFWFKPAPSNSFGLLRMAVGLLALIQALQLWPDRMAWFSERGLLPTAMSDTFNRIYTPGPRPLNLLHAFHPDWFITLFLAVYIAAAILMMVGWQSRLATVLVFLCLNVIRDRNAIVNTTGGDTIMLCMAFYLMLGPCGAACSLDRLRRVLDGREGDEPSSMAPWPLRLAQIQVCVVYACTALVKLQGPVWQNGTAVYYPYMLPEFHRFPVPFFDARHLWLINAMTYSAVGIEFALAFLVWVPRLRLYVLGLGVLLHMGIEYMLNIPLFAWLMVASYLAFVRLPDIRNFVTWLPRTIGLKPLRVVYDGECDFCRSVLLIVRFLDVLRLVRFLDYHDPEELKLADGVTVAEAEQAAIGVDDRGRLYRGFYAFRQICRRVPLLLPLMVVTYLPGVPALGEKAYRWVAENRSHLPVAGRYRVRTP